MPQPEQNIAGPKILIFIAIFSLIAYFVNVRPILANHATKLGLAQMQYCLQYSEKYIQTSDKQYLNAAKSSFNSGIAYLDKALNYGTYQNSEIREGYSEAFFSLPLESLLSKEEIEEFSSKVAAKLEKNLTDNPQSVRVFLQIMTIYNKAAQYNYNYSILAENLGKKILLIDPTHPQTYFELGKAKFVQSQFNEGIIYFQKAIELNPENVTSHWNLAIAYIKLDKIAEAKEEIAIMEKIGYSIKTPPEIQKWIGIYEQVNDVEKLVWLYDEMIKAIPTATCYAKAAVYNQRAGNIEKAKKYAFKAAEMDPTLKDKVNAFIQEF